MAQEFLIKSYLKQLKLPAMAQNYSKLAKEAAEANMPYEDYLLALLEQETAHRVENATRKRIARARFPYLRTLDQFNFSAIPSLNKSRVLELSRGGIYPGQGEPRRYRQHGHRQDPSCHKPGTAGLPAGLEGQGLHCCRAY